MQGQAEKKVIRDRDFGQTSKKQHGGIEHGAQNNVAGGVWNSPREGQAGAPFQAFSQNGVELLRFQPRLMCEQAAEPRLFNAAKQTDRKLHHFGLETSRFFNYHHVTPVRKARTPVKVLQRQSLLFQYSDDVRVQVAFRLRTAPQS